MPTLRRIKGSYRGMFDRKRIGHLLNTSFAIGNEYEKSMRGLVMDARWPYAAVARARLDFTHPEAICHYIPEPMKDGVKSWMIFVGYLSDEAAKYAGWLLEFGLHDFWEGSQRDIMEMQTEAYRRKANTTSIREVAGARGAVPISMEFGIMRIFPICGVIAGVAGFVLCMEYVHLEAVRANMREG